MGFVWLEILFAMNKVMLIGNVGKDPDVRYYDQDQAVAQVSLATTERGYTLQNGTQVPDHTDWHNVIFYRGLAKVVEKYVRDDKRGMRRMITEIYAENMELLSPRKPAEGNPQPSQTTAANVSNSDMPPF